MEEIATYKATAGDKEFDTLVRDIGMGFKIDLLSVVL